MTRSEFEQCIEDALSTIPERIRSRIDNVAFLVENDVRSAKNTEKEIVSKGILLGLYQGVPLIERRGLPTVFPDRITIFQRPIEERGYHDPFRIRQIVFDTVHHEVAHYFGMNEKEVRALERKRRRR